jgi:hypothetical protein
VLRGLGGASFGPVEQYQAGSLSLGVIAEDVDDDGWPDLVAPANSGRVGVYLNQRDGTLYVPATLAAASEPVAIADADLDHDSHPDLVVANAFAQTFSVFLGLGQGAFAPRVDFAAGGEPRELATGDLNNDGHLDVVLANGGGTLATRFGDGAGGFGPLKSYAAGPPDALTIADFDGDGLLDVAAASSQANVVSILLGRGHGLLGPKTDIAAGPLPMDLVHGDFDGDGLLDLAVADQTSGSFGPGKLAFLRGHGDGTSARRCSTTRASRPTRSRRATSTTTATSTSRSRSTSTSSARSRSCSTTATGPSRRRCSIRRAASPPTSSSATSTATTTPTWPSRTPSTPRPRSCAARATGPSSCSRSTRRAWRRWR